MRRLLNHLSSGPAINQLFRYACIGILTNAAGYGLYLFICSLGAQPKITMSALYLIGATIGYFSNRSLTFSHQGAILGSAARYVVAHLCGYLINLAMLFVFVDRLGYRHQYVQGAAVLTLALFLFLTFRYFVFPTHRPRTT